MSRAAFRRVPRNGKPCFTMLSTLTTIMPRDAESRQTCCLQSVMSCVRNKLIWLLVTSTVLRGVRRAAMTNRATARSRKRSPTRIYHSHTAPRRCGVQETFQATGPTYVDSSSHRILTMSGRYAVTARSKPIAMFLAVDPTDQSCHHEVRNPPFTRQRSAGRPILCSQCCSQRARLAAGQEKEHSI